MEQHQQQPALPNATASLVLGILSIPLGCLCYAIPGLVLGILAFSFSKKALRLDAEHPGEYTGAGNAKAGRITGIIGIILSSLMFIIYLAIIGLYGFAVLSNPEELQELIMEMQNQ